MKICFLEKSKCNNSKVKPATTFKFCLRYVQRIISTCRKFGNFSVVGSVFIKVRKKASKYKIIIKNKALETQAGKQIRH